MNKLHTDRWQSEHLPAMDIEHRRSGWHAGARENEEPERERETERRRDRVRDRRGTTCVGERKRAARLRPRGGVATGTENDLSP